MGCPQWVQPLLAVSWENVDKLTWRMRLRPNAKFHNGEAFNADAVVQDVLYTIEGEGKGCR